MFAATQWRALRLQRDVGYAGPTRRSPVMKQHDSTSSRSAARTEDLTGQIDGVDVADELFVVVRAGDALTIHPLPSAGQLTLGRADDNDVCIEHKSVSRHHAVLSEMGGEVMLTDLGSSNGTAVGKSTVLSGQTLALRVGTVAKLGAATVQLQASALTQTPDATPADRPLGRLDRECHRSQRSGSAFAVVLVSAPPVIPRAEVDDLLAAVLRTADEATALAPGEHQLVLVDTDPDQARVAVERLFKRATERGIDLRAGFACYPLDGTTGASLVDSARSRLERAVDSGVALVGVERPASWSQLVDHVAASDLSILILGETGVGKEVCAERIHQQSMRNEGPFLKLNCAALSGQLLESELFGHERGAFTGAVTTKPGLLEATDGGTLFLDEVGELPLVLQAKLLRVLEDGSVLRVGALRPRTVDVRFVAATNRALDREIAEGRFRRDLFYRLSGAEISIPPLRERVDEIESLARGFVTEVCARSGAATPDIDAGTMRALESRSWPGNIRELRNAMERAVLLCRGAPILPSHLPAEARSFTDAQAEVEVEVEKSAPRRARRARQIGLGRFNEEVAEVERKQIVDALTECGGNQTRAAKLLGIARGTLQSRMDTYGIPRPRKRQQ
jgi:DNA-binding NtrC family response regulator